MPMFKAVNVCSVVWKLDLLRRYQIDRRSHGRSVVELSGAQGSGALISSRSRGRSADFGGARGAVRLDLRGPETEETTADKVLVDREGTFYLNII